MNHPISARTKLRYWTYESIFMADKRSVPSKGIFGMRSWKTPRGNAMISVIYFECTAYSTEPFSLPLYLECLCTYIHIHSHLFYMHHEISQIHHGISHCVYDNPYFIICYSFSMGAGLAAVRTDWTRVGLHMDFLVFVYSYTKTIYQVNACGFTDSNVLKNTP